MKLKAMAVLLLYPALAVAQANYVTVTATVVDPNGNPFMNAQVTAALVSPQGIPVQGGCFTPNGALFNGNPTRGTLTSAGVMSLQLVPNGTLNCPMGGTNTHWHFTITEPSDSSILRYGQAWTINYDATVTGSVDLSVQLSALAQPIAYFNVRTGQTSALAAAAVNPAKINGYIYANQYATGGNGTPGSPWTSPSGTGGIQEAINAAPVTTGSVASSTVYLPTGYYAVNSTITMTVQPVNLIGAGWNTVLYVNPLLSNTSDIISVAPTASAQFKGFIFSDFLIQPISGTPGRYGIRLDGTSNEIQQGLISHVNIQKLGGNVAIYATGSGAAQGTPVLTRIEKSILIGGIQGTSLGDSVVLRDNQIAGSGTNIFSFQTGATGFIMDGNNVTNDGGTQFASGNTFAPKIINNEFETQGTFTGSNGALLDFDGTGGQILGGVIAKNTFNVISPIVGSSIRLNTASDVHIEGNTFARGASGSTDVVMTSLATNNFLLTNYWTAGGPLTSMFSDAGSHNVEFFPFLSGSTASGPTLMNGEPLLGVASSGNTYPLVSMNGSNTICLGGYLGAQQLCQITGTTFVYNGSNGQIVGAFGVAGSTSVGSSTVATFYALALNTGHILFSSTAPTVSSGFGATSPSIQNANGTADFEINVGTGTIANTGVIGLPAATAGWHCWCDDKTTFTTSVFKTRQTNTTPSTTSCTVGNFSSAAVAGPWTAGDVLMCYAHAY